MPRTRWSKKSTSLGSSFYAYNSAGDLVSYTDADGRVTTYQYNAQNENDPRKLVRQR